MAKKFPKQRLPELLRRLHQAYGKAECALNHDSPFQLLAATILSAQCTDERVNKVTPQLFARYPTPYELAEANQGDVEEVVRSTGFFRNKAKNLIGMARGLVADHDGEVPKTIEELTALPGVARKTANVVLGTSFGIAVGVVVDTHVMRISRLLGLVSGDTPVKIERELVEQLPQEEWIQYSHMIIHHGRQVCIARRPQCDRCTLNDLCVSAFASPPPNAKESGKAQAKSKSGKAKGKTTKVKTRKRA